MTNDPEGKPSLSPQPSVPGPDPTPPEEPVKGSKKSKNALLVYVAVMFAVAFLLVLFSFFLQQRSSNEAITTLSQSSASATGRVQELEEAQTALTGENMQLQDQIEDLSQALADLQAAYDGITADNAQICTDYETLLADYNALQQDAAALTQSLNDAAAQRVQLEEQLAQLQARIAQLEAQLTYASSEHAE